jgi:hypothetical protein
LEWVNSATAGNRVDRKAGSPSFARAFKNWIGKPVSQIKSAIVQTRDQRLAALLLLSETLHFSALVAKRKGDRFSDVMEQLADSLFRDREEIASSPVATSDAIVKEALDILSRFEVSNRDVSRTRH